MGCPFTTVYSINVPNYQVYGLRLWSPRGLAYLAAASPASETLPDIKLIIHTDENPATFGGGLPWRGLRKQVGHDWSLTLSTAQAEGDSWLRLHTRRRRNEI